jgi:hypothetical protein
MIRKLIKIVPSIVLCFAASIAYAAQQATVLETDLFTVNLPAGFRPLLLKSQRNEKNDFTYAYIESDKAKQKSILIIVTAERNKNIKKKNANAVLYTATNALRNYTSKSNNCEGELTALLETTIGNSKALFFEKRNQRCNVSIEKYWSVIKEDYFITFYIAKPVGGNIDLFNQVQDSIKQVQFK